jgi:1-deoxy-D-xylulose-5-phosphate reductoisomerase
VKRIAVLGSTGSIGRQTLDVVRWHPDEFKIQALVAAHPSEAFDAQVREFGPCTTCLTATDGAERLLEIACDADVDVLVVATSGTVGFRPTIAALEGGKAVALANKETLIMAGHLVTEAAAASGAPLLPIDSEHSAIWQCLQGEQPYGERVRRLVLTASGGAFRDRDARTLAEVTPAEALHHPTWTMGPKITIDSATLMNKGLEVIEARWLFGLPFDQIDVLIHHQSVIHSLVEFVDGSVKAQLGVPDMRLPIQYALAHPRRLTTPTDRLDLAAIAHLTFADVDAGKYPCLGLAYQAGRTAGTYPTVLNAANEEAVALFLANDLGFMRIAELIDAALQAHQSTANPDLEQVLAADTWAREFARGWRAVNGSVG